MGRPFEGKIYKCINCSADFRRSKSEIKRGRTKYCGLKCSGLSHRGINNHNWNGGSFITSSGYKMVYIGAKKYIPEHRYLVEKKTGKKLGDNYDVHHKDGNKLNNSIDNLEILKKGTHTALHHRGEKNNHSKLCTADVLSIRYQNKLGVTAKELAKIYNVDVSNIRYITNRVTWKHI